MIYSFPDNAQLQLNILKSDFFIFFPQFNFCKHTADELRSKLNDYKQRGTVVILSLHAPQLF